MVDPTPRSRFSSLRRWTLYLAVVVGVSTAVWYFGFGKKPERQRYPQPPWAGQGHPPLVPVRTVAAERQDLPVRLRAIGTVTPLNTVTVKSRVEGQLLRVAFEEGQLVHRGDLLAEIDPASYRILVTQAEGELQQTTALLDTARSDLERQKGLHRQNLITDQQLEAQQAVLAQREGAVRSMEAELADARLKLDYTRIVAPIEGRAGFRQVDPGNLIEANDTAGLVVLTQTHPITVVFTVPEGDLDNVLEPLRRGQSVEVEAWDRNDKQLLATGLLKTADNQIDIATGTLRLKAEFANTDDRLFPNQFVNVRLRVRTLADAVVIPSAAVQFGARGTYVFVVDAENKAHIRDLELGPVEGLQQAVAKGLAPGDRVVVEGLDRLREGSGVVMANTTPGGPSATTGASAAK